MKIFPTLRHLGTTLLPGLLLALLPACDNSEKLKRFPAGQVATVQAMYGQMDRIQAIIDGPGTAAQKVLALEALQAELQALYREREKMSRERLTNIIYALDYDADREWDMHEKTYEHGLQLGRATDSALHTLFYGERTHPTPAETAATLLRYVEELEGALDGPGDKLEALRLYRDRLRELYPSSDDARELERLLCETPGAAERLEQHLQRMRPPYDNVVDSHLAGDMPSALWDYWEQFSGLVVQRLHRLTPTGQQELAAIRDFLQAAPGASFYLGRLSIYPHNDTGQHRICLELDEGYTVRSATYYHIEFPAGGSADEAEEMDKASLQWSTCLLRVEGEPLHFTPERETLAVAHPQNMGSLRELPAKVHPLPGGWRALLRVCEQHPELRKRVKNPVAPDIPLPTP